METIAGEELQNLDLNSPLCAFDQGGIFIVPHLLASRASVFAVSSARLSPLYDKHGVLRIYLFLRGSLRGERQKKRGRTGEKKLKKL